MCFLRARSTEGPACDEPKPGRTTSLVVTDLPGTVSACSGVEAFHCSTEARQLNHCIQSGKRADRPCSWETRKGVRR